MEILPNSEFGIEEHYEHAVAVDIDPIALDDVEPITGLFTRVTTTTSIPVPPLPERTVHARKNAKFAADFLRDARNKPV